jgi:hypothetical protein
MTHIAIQEKLDGKVVEWIEQVSEEEYRKLAEATPVSPPFSGREWRRRRVG